MLRSFPLGRIEVIQKRKKRNRNKQCHVGCFLTARRMSVELPLKDESGLLPECTWKTKQMPGFIVKDCSMKDDQFFEGARFYLMHIPDSCHSVGALSFVSVFFVFVCFPPSNNLLKS